MNNELWEKSAQAWIEFAERDLNRHVLLDPVMLRLAGDVRGLQVCDVGCGEGRFARQLGEGGAVVTGLEPTRNLIEEARRRQPDADFIQATAEAIPVRDEAFDLLVSYVMLIDVPDYRAAIREMVRVCRRGGRILVANLNSFCTTSARAWVRDEAGELLHVAVDHYLDERAVRLSWAGIDVINYHRPFEAYMQTFLSAGLRLTHFEEPRITEEQARDYPSMADGLRVPFFHVMEWRKE